MGKTLLSRSRVGPCAVFAFALVFVASAYASPVDITIWDRLGTDPSPAIGENNETEPGTVASGVEPWDLEGFLYDSTTGNLSVVGEYPFGTGILHGGNTYVSGDIFLAVVPSLPDPAQAPNADGSDFDYVIDITQNNDYTTGLNSTFTYTVYSLSGATTTTGELLTTTDIHNTNPYRYDHGGTLVTSGTFSLTSYTDATALNTALGTSYTDSLAGNDHYVLSGFNLSFLPAGNIFTHYTYECGNDLVTGYMSGFTPPPPPVPEPATMLIVGLGLASAALGKRSVKRLIS